ncbi:MAG TPA: ferrous iron transport protein B [Candidatus Fermentibacter daniensis]|jgi:ferrous iron transport protein B|nr:MAG: hypothetical protein AO394_03005 [Candidatus Fermentibacter daniensis]MBP7719010.1 ferrous iron transport protein B [Candidatus Fermentibacter sp.]MCC6871310.1 ferrous iron transport protein B [Candidatus Fermentibacter sp.]HOA05948.1 ferrous iron transport protein B [Candidatus Fermentibacter daniensis]HOD19728.1 ferrous iron transport protein B [Candidatus Fermentibacter daniensis]
MNSVRVALVGNPNTGKSSIFNRLTGSSAHEGNYPGVTVELFCGSRTIEGRLFRFIDLPGQYSLMPASADEAVAVKGILEDPPDLVLNVVDATNLERNLQFTLQLAQLGLRMVVALNMSDEAEAAGRMPNVSMLSERLGVPVVRTVGRTGEGLSELIRVIARTADSDARPRRLIFGVDTDPEIESVASLIPDGPISATGIATMLVEGSAEAEDLLRRSFPDGAGAVVEAAGLASERLESLYGDPAQIVLAGLRHGLASGLATEVLGRPRRRSTTPLLTRRIDSVLLNRYLGVPIFALIMYLVFWLTFKASAPFEHLISRGFSSLAGLMRSALPDGPLQSLLADGITGGVGGVILYAPGISVLFLAISLMEDTGYMSRAAFLTDGLMHRFGLHGRSFIPMLLGFGCTVPAVLAARTLESRRDRLATILVLPLISCGARLPVYLMVTRAFFPGRQAIVLSLLYGSGMALALLGARLLRKTVLSGEDSPFVMELPPYRMPTLKALWRHVWARLSHYLAKAGTVILAFSVVLWLLGYFPRPREGADRAQALEESFAGRIGHALEPVMEPLGFDWRISTAMVGAAGAKELFISQTAILSSLSEDDEADLSSVLAARYAPATGVAVLVFMLISPPCLATVAMVKKETGSWRIALAQYAALMILAWLLAFLSHTLFQIALPDRF